MIYTMVAKSSYLVTHLEVAAADVSMMPNHLFILAEECEGGALGQKLDINTGLFHDYVLTMAEFQAEHMRIFSESDIVIVRHLEGSELLTPEMLAEWQSYRTDLRARFHSYTPTANYQWPVTPL